MSNDIEDDGYYTVYPDQWVHGWAMRRNGGSLHGIPETEMEGVHCQHEWERRELATSVYYTCKLCGEEAYDV